MALSRRSFLKGSAAAAAAVSTSASASVAFYDEQKIPHATHFGAFTATVNSEGKITAISPHESDLHPSVITQAVIDRTHSDTRVKYPCVRKSFLEGKHQPQLRGREPFVRVSWEQLYELLHKKLAAIKPENIFNASYGGWGHVGLLHNCNAVAGRFFNTVLGGAVGTDGEYSNGAAGKVNTAICGDLEVYSLQTNYEMMLKHCEVYVMWGADIYKDNQIDFKVANRENDVYMKKYAESNIEFISVDPQRTIAADILDAKWLKIIPNTDIAMILGLCHYLYKSGKYNKEFIEKYTDGFDKFLPYLLGKTDGVAKTPEWASKICGISADEIKKLADLMASKRTFIAGNWANQRAQYGENADWAIITLACMLGQVGLPGGGFGFAMHYCSAAGAFAGAMLPVGLPQGKNSVGINIPASRVSEAILNPGKTINFKGKTFTYPQIKMFYVAGASVLGHHPNTNELIHALRQLETVVVHEPWWTPMAKMADIVIPATTTLERNDISFGGSYSQDWVYAMKKVVEPAYESKDDYEVFAELARRFGEREHAKFTGGHADQMSWIKSFYEKSDCADEMSFDEFWDKGSLHFETPKEAYEFVRHADFRKDPKNNPLATESGKIQIFSKKFDELNLPDFKGHIIWQEPAEYLGSPLAKKFPFHLLSPHPRYRIHSQLDNTWLRNIYKIQGREPVVINTEDAKRLGIAHGDVVEVYNDRGALLAGAFVTDDIRPGVLAIQEGAWYDPEEPAEQRPRCNQGHVNVLTSSRPSSQMAQATSVNSCLVAIRKATGEIKPYASITPPTIIGAQK